MLLDGVHVPLTVPFYASGESYLKKLEHNVQRYCLGPIAGLIALPPGLEADGLSTEEQHATLRTVGSTTSPEKVLIAGVCRGSVQEAVALAHVAEEAEFDAVLLSAPNHWPRLRGCHSPTGELSLFFQTVADQSPLPVVLWSDKKLPCVQLSVDLLAFLAAHPNVLGVCDADLSIERFSAVRERTASVRREVTVTTVFAPVTRRMLKVRATKESSFVPATQLAGGNLSLAVAPPTEALHTRTRQMSFQIMAAGRVNGVSAMLGAGVPGFAPELAACAPQGCHEIYAAFKDGNSALTAEKEERLWAADSLLTKLGPAGLKYACDLNGFYGGRPRLPLLPLIGSERARVEEALRGVRN